MKNSFLIITFCFTITGSVEAQSDLKIPFKKIGEISPRSSTEIYSNNWSIGAETMDRDLVEFDSWKDYLKDLGAKKIRLQAGWAKCEKEKGVYDFEWLDRVIDFVLSQGVEPWLQTSYGNPIYDGGGGIHLSAGLPSSEEALQAWDEWVNAMVKRYRGRVKFWEVWNEPDNKDKTPPEQYADLFIRTAENIKAKIPDATIFALSQASLGKKGQNYVETFLKTLKEQNKLHLVDEITLHGYTYNPSDVYRKYNDIYPIIRKYADHIKIRQGELGCPSEFQDVYALRNYEWTELSQSKWVVRKMLGDLGRDIPSSYFLIIDIVYTHNHEELMDKPKRNTKGLIESDLQRNFVALKPSYYSYQNVTSIFDNTLERIPNYPYSLSSESSISVFGFRRKHFDNQAVAIWKDGEIPTNKNNTSSVDIEFAAGNFEAPVFIDLRTGDVFEIPAKNWNQMGTAYSFKNIPIYDSPILIADKTLINLKEQ
ncbi:GH39 family glycosyl hydrolase [Ulvibacterium sp.]|uniref:GH39 family glycosyl hydrolase n=1 Tax=Ulvibacterium sp. TaxID=2665914 RepID=UPI003BAB621D